MIVNEIITHPDGEDCQNDGRTGKNSVIKGNLKAPDDCR